MDHPQSSAIHAYANPLFNMSVAFAVDISASMMTRDVRGMTRFQAIQEGAMALASKMCSIGLEGLDLYVFGRGARMVASKVGPEQVGDIFSRMSLESRTDTHELIARVNEDRDRTKNTLLIIATDGAPSDTDKTRDAILQAAATCNPSKRDPKDTDDFKILFYQIGSDWAATQFLRELDDDLVKRYGARFDIVDAKTVDEIDGKDPFEVAMEALED